jgi:PAS domain S-box-containing protein
MDIQVLFVAPFETLANLARTVVEEGFKADKELIHIIVGDLQEASGCVKKAVEDGAEVIVSRGGTASLIEQCVDVPIIHIQVTVTDVLRALIHNGNYPDKIGIAGFANMIYGCDELGKMLGIHFYEIALKEEAEAEQKITKAVGDGVELIVGDAISTKMAIRLGIQGELIQSGKEAIYRALHEALLIARIRREEQRKSEILRMVINHSQDGIIAVDRDRKITLFNPVVEKLFKTAYTEAMGKNIECVIPQLPAAKDDDMLQQVEDKTVAMRNVEIKVKEEVVGEIYTVQNVSEVQRFERNIRKKMSQKGLVAKYHMDDIIGRSAACLDMKRKAAKYALTESTILITGESGTGKEMLVQSIHNMSMRARGPFVAVNCAALPENLLESELFGYAEGAFTGAKKGGHQGFFELAHGGTLFLDEMGEMPLALQSRLLRVLQEREVMPLGGESVIPVDVRIIAATNRNLAQMIEEGKLRQDLYYRLNILRIHMPSLRERKDDIPILAKQLIREMHSLQPQIIDIHEDARDYLKSCQWPGNIRQLANMIERVMLLSRSPVICKQDVLDAYQEDEQAGKKETVMAGPDNLAGVEKETLHRVLQEEDFNYSRAAKRLGIHRTTLWRKLNKK